MLRALLKKQFLELNTFYFQNKKTGKARSKGSAILFILLFVILFASLGAVFAVLGLSLAEPLNAVGLDWLYFSLMGSLSLVLGVFGSVFNTYASLYKAKDNDFLLSLPIPSWKILFVRLIGVYAMGLLYEALVLVPSVIVYFVAVGVKASALTGSVLMIFVIAFIILVLTCILGWAVAVVSTKIKNKSFVTVLSSLLFLALYYAVYFRISSFLQTFAENGEEIGASVRKYAYPIYMLGQAFLGSIPDLIIAVICAGVLLCLTYLILSKSFLKISISGQASEKKEGKKEATKQSGISRALLAKELRRFLSCPTYMLNCALGTVLLPVTAIVLILKKELLLSYVDLLSSELGVADKVIPVFVCAAVCLLTSMNNITSPSVSLEGKNIWIVQSLPVEAKYVLSAKKKLHFLITAIPALILSCVAFYVFGIDIAFSCIGSIFILVYIYFSAAAGLALNLKMPNLSWQNEAVPIKQSAPTTLSIFGGWFICIIFGGGYWFLKNSLSPLIYIVICLAVVSALTVVCENFTNKKGAEIFSILS